MVDNLQAGIKKWWTTTLTPGFASPYWLRVLNQTHYSAADKAQIVDRLTKLGLNGSDEGSEDDACRSASLSREGQVMRFTEVRIVRAHHRSLTLLILVALVASPVSASELGAWPDQPGLTAPYEDAPVETSFDANDAEVLFYANKHDVPLARAVEIANWLEDAAPLLTALPELTATYADARLVHGGSDAAPELAVGEVRVEVKAKDPSDPDLRSLAESIESLRVGQFAADVVVHQVPRSLAELNSLAAAELARVDPDSVAVEYDFDRGKVILVPVPEPEPNTIWTSQCSNVSGGWLDGGRRIRLDNDTTGGCQTEAECTSGFPMRFANSYGVTTAGHCVDGIGANYAANSSGFVTNYSDRDTDMYWVYQPNDIFVSANAYWFDGPFIGPNDDDVAFLRRVDTSAIYPAQIWKWDTSEWRHITGYELTYALVGMTVCAAASPASVNGAGTYCGEVIDSLTNAIGTDSGILRWTEVDYTQGDYHVGKSGGPGSSGGTIFYGGFVYGMQSHASNCDASGTLPCTPARYYRTLWLRYAMLDASSDVEFICYNAQFCELS